MARWYRFYGGAVVAALAWAFYSGWSSTEVDQVKRVPKTVRDNPGVYRSHYSSYHRTYGGK